MFSSMLRFLHRDKIFKTPANRDDPWYSEQLHEYEVMPRMLAVVRPRQPFYQWERRHDKGYTASLATCRRDSSIAYLVPTMSWELGEIDPLLQKYWDHFFAQALESHHYARDKWPRDRSLTMFRHWFDVEVCEQIIDLGRYEDGPR